jgi:hypothetical protein
MFTFCDIYVLKMLRSVTLTLCKLYSKIIISNVINNFLHLDLLQYTLFLTNLIFLGLNLLG